jgi:hypothetical protein
MPVTVTPGGPPALRPRFYYGWVLVITLGLTETVSWGVLYYAFAVFVLPMEAELGWSRAAISGAFSLAVLVSGLAAVPVGRWLDRNGPRALMTAGAAAGTLLVLAWSAVRDLPVFYLIWGAIGLTMAAVLYDPAFAVVTVWFRRRRARALTAVTLMAGLASTIFLPLSGWLLERQGWRLALVSLAAILGAATVLPHALLLRRRPADLGLAPDGDPLPPPDAAGPAAPPAARSGIATSAVLRLTGFGWLATAFSLYSLAASGVAVHLVPSLAERGWDLRTAAGLAGAIGAMQLVGRLLFAPLEGRATRSGRAAGRLSRASGEPAAAGWLTAAILLVQPVALAVYLLFPGVAGVAVFVVLYGAGRGAATLARATSVAGRYGTTHYASISGVLTLCVTVAQAAGPLATGAGYDRFGAYEPVFWALAAVSTVAALAAVLSQRALTAPPS